MDGHCVKHVILIFIIQRDEDIKRERKRRKKRNLLFVETVSTRLTGNVVQRAHPRRRNRKN